MHFSLKIKTNISLEKKSFVRTKKIRNYKLKLDNGIKIYIFYLYLSGFLPFLFQIMYLPPTKTLI